jgi:hypothetical protein
MESAGSLIPRENDCLIPRENDCAVAVPVTILESVLFCLAAV